MGFVMLGVGCGGGRGGFAPWAGYKSNVDPLDRAICYSQMY